MKPLSTAARASIVVFLLTAMTRIPFVSSLYFADGPAHLRAIESGTYLIQPPGYWLFNRVAGLFPNPTMAISVMNILFASLGAVTFHAAAKRLMSPGRARLATGLYATVFYAWFSAEVHSTYASQLLFPVLTFYLLLRSKEAAGWLYAAAVAFGIGAGLRPSDGAFLLPMMLYFLFVRVGWRRAWAPALTAVGVCTGWLVPTLAGYHRLGGIHGAVVYAVDLSTKVSVQTGLHEAWAANVTRLVLPLIVALGPVLSGAFRRWDEEDKLLALWIAPGFLFFLLIYVSYAPYLVYFTAAFILLCARGISPWILTATAVFNAALFLWAVPIRASSLPVKAFNHYVTAYTLQETRQHRMRDLSQDRYAPY